MPLIAVPYHLGQRGVEVGAGPLIIIKALDRLCTIIETSEGLFAVNSALTKAIAASPTPPTVLAGNCNSCLRTLAALENPGVVWLDAHGDFNTPETAISGALEGMSLAIATGHCHQELMAKPVREENVVLAATRDLDPLERVRLSNSRVMLAGLDKLAAEVAGLAARVETLYLHIDLDVLNPEQSPGVNFHAPGGISKDELFQAVRRVMATRKLAAAAITNFNPSRDRENRTLKIALDLIFMLDQIS